MPVSTHANFKPLQSMQPSSPKCQFLGGDFLKHLNHNLAKSYEGLVFAVHYVFPGRSLCILGADLGNSIETRVVTCCDVSLWLFRGLFWEVHD
jgi:hypothetical protein